MNVASLELCKELYELSGWVDTYLNHWTNTQSGLPISNAKALFGYGKVSGWKQEAYPAYDCGYLLRKLPYKVLDEYGGKVYGVNLKSTASGGWVVWYGEIGKSSEMYFNSADTPEDALCKLAIELFKQGILQKEAA